MGTSAKDVKNRIKSVQSTMHITKAMELVASSKLKRAKERMEKCQAYFEIIQNALNDIASGDSSNASIYINSKKEVKKKCFIVIAGDRGLAGGYNNNIFKLVLSNMDVESCVVPIGKRSLEFFERRNSEILSKDFSIIDSLGRKDSIKLGQMLTKEFEKGSFDELYIVYTHFNNMLSQSANIIKILPLSTQNNAEKQKGYVLYEPSAEAVFGAIIPEYVSGIIYGAICDSYACELAARRIAMDSASKNAEKMIDDLSLKYNRARQNAITQEITEIVGGAEG